MKPVSATTIAVGVFFGLATFTIWLMIIVAADRIATYGWPPYPHSHVASAAR